MFGDIRGHSTDDAAASPATAGHELLEWSATAGSATAGPAAAELSLPEPKPATAG